MDKRVYKHGSSTDRHVTDKSTEVGQVIHGSNSPSRSQHKLPEPFCSPIGHHDQFPLGGASPGYGGMTPSTHTMEAAISPNIHSSKAAGDMSPQVYQSHGGMTSLSHPSPSPGSKRFVGVSNNAMNDIYMKTLINSPYHKSYTSMSAASCSSPAYQTPIRSRVEPTESPMKGVSWTPQGTAPPSTGNKRFITPKNMAMNPFDNGIDDLHMPAYMSPGFFTVASTPGSEKKSFRWSIEHIAELNPADIDEMPQQHTHPVVPDRETEERAQRAIEQFFANNIIAPSPWTDPKKKKKKPILPATPAHQGSGSGQGEDMMTELQGSIQKSLPSKQGMEDACCQTMLSLPVNFDLQKVLGSYMTKEDIEEGNQADMLSTSSLRRKLFFHGDTSSLAPSPVKGVRNTSPPDIEPMSPMFVKQKTPNWNHTTPLKNTPAFSSSPIRSAGTPQYRRCSSDPEFLASPELSPIVHGNLPKSVKKSRSSGMFDPHRDSFNMSPINVHSDMRGGHSPVSPIPFQGISPEDGCGEELRPKFEDSPGFSPIRPPKTPIRKMLRKSQEESYIQDECSVSDDDESVTPVSSNPRLQSNSLTPVHCLSPIQPPPHRTQSNYISRSFSCTDLKQEMDFESAASPSKPARYTDNIMTSSICDTRDFDVSDLDYHDETNQRTHSHSSSQDTGYQTTSLQSTNHESVSLHTNLTNQFGSLPFNLTNQDGAFQNTSHQIANQDRPPILNLTQQFTSIADNEKALDQNNSISKQLFPKQNTLAQKLFFMEDESDKSDNENTPKNTGSSRSHLHDSALPNESLMLNDSGQGQMEIDFRKDNIGNEHEEEVVSRARQAIAMANNLYPYKSKTGVTLPTDSVTYLEPMSASTPEKVKYMRQIDGQAGNNELHASEMAFSLLQKAKQDLAKYENILSHKPTNL